MIHADSEKERTVIFLDIDGVLQPLRGNQRFNYDLRALCQQLAREYDNEEYCDMDPYDVGAVYYDWDKKAVERLRRLCQMYQAEIVISSAWRSYSPLSRLQAFFRLHDLDQYVTDVIPQIPMKSRCEEVTAYLNDHPEVQRFVILDDAHLEDFETHYPDQFVYCQLVFDEACYEEAARILAGPTLPQE